MYTRTPHSQFTCHFLPFQFSIPSLPMSPFFPVSNPRIYSFSPFSSLFPSLTLFCLWSPLFSSSYPLLSSSHHHFSQYLFLQSLFPLSSLPVLSPFSPNLHPLHCMGISPIFNPSSQFLPVPFSFSFFQFLSVSHLVSIPFSSMFLFPVCSQ